MEAIVASQGPGSSEAMRTNEIRKRILDEHRRLRDRLEMLELAVEAVSEDPKRRASVHRSARKTLSFLIEHTLLEDTILAPALLQADAWGPIRASAMLEHHEAQREELRRLIRTYEHSWDDGDRMAATTLAWIEEVRADMEREEYELLSNDLLNDETVAIDGEAG